MSEVLLLKKIFLHVSFDMNNEYMYLVLEYIKMYAPKLYSAGLANPLHPKKKQKSSTTLRSSLNAVCCKALLLFLLRVFMICCRHENAT